LGLPLQRDIEMPAVNFIKENPIFFFTGFGSGNYNLIPISYFTSDWNLKQIEDGEFKGHFDMGWIYIICEYGIIYFLILFFLFSKTKKNSFTGRFYSFLWLVFFFHRIDFLLLTWFSILNCKTQINSNEEENIIHY
jgi:hypothetical protein